MPEHTVRRIALGRDELIEPADGERPAGADVFHGYLLHDEDLELAVNVALATRRALLLEGPSGAGKSVVAEAVARRLGWRLYAKVITSRTQAQDLLWEVDLVRRINDAQGSGIHDDLGHYVTPGVLWWAFDPASAATVAGHRPEPRRRDPSPIGSADQPAVVLLDEIDKADPDVPNDLLVPLGGLEFRVDVLEPTDTDDAERVVTRPGLEPLVIITSNLERDLSPAFLRRCVRYYVDLPAPEVYVRIAERTIPGCGPVAEALAESLLDTPRPEPGEDDTRVSIATFRDAVQAAMELGIEPGTHEGDRLLRVFKDWRLGQFGHE